MYWKLQHVSETMYSQGCTIKNLHSFDRNGAESTWRRHYRRLHDNDNPYTRSSPTSYVPLLKILQTFSVIRKQLPVSKLSDLETCTGQKNSLTLLINSTEDYQILRVKHQINM